MSEVVIQFECDLDAADCLMLVYDVLCSGPEDRFFANATTDNFDWLVDELASVAPEVHEQLIEMRGRGLQQDLPAHCLRTYELLRREKTRERLRGDLHNLESVV